MRIPVLRLCALLLTLSALATLVTSQDPTTEQRRFCGINLANILQMVCQTGFHLGKRFGRSVGPVYNSYSYSKHSTSVDDTYLHTNNYTDFNLDIKDIDSLVNLPIDNADSVDNSITAHPAGSPSNTLSNPSTDSVSGARRYRSLLLRASTGEGHAPMTSRRKRRSSRLVEDCCQQACTMATLTTYCADPDMATIQPSLADLRRHLGFHTDRGHSYNFPRPPGHYPYHTTVRPDMEFGYARGRQHNRERPVIYLQYLNNPTRRPLIESQ